MNWPWPPGDFLGLKRKVRAIRIRSNLCAECGYDLRASPLRCPECNTIPDPLERARVSEGNSLRFNRFTDRARKVAKMAINASLNAGDTIFFPRHILAAIAAEGSGVGAHILTSVGVSLAAITGEFHFEFGPTKSRLRSLASTAATELADSAVAEALFISDNHVGTEHFVLALLANPGCLDAARHLLSGDALYRTALITLLGLQAHWLRDRGDYVGSLARCNILLDVPSANILNLKAGVLSTAPDVNIRRPREAILLATKALELAPTDCHVLDTLAEAYAAAGDFVKAVEFAERAVALAAEPHLAVYRSHLQLFREGNPVIHTPASVSSS